MSESTTNPAVYFSEVVRQNRLLKETINSFSGLLDEHLLLDLCSPTQYGTEQTAPDGTFSCTPSPTLSSTSSQSTIEALIDLLDRQESRLNLLEEFGTNVLRNTHLPIFRGLKRTKDHPDEIDVRNWCDLVSHHIKTLKSINSNGLDLKEFIKFIIAHLDLAPLKLMNTLLERNRLLVRSKFPREIPTECRDDHSVLEYDQTLLCEYPCKLHVLRHPRALLNLFQSKFTDKKPTSLQALNHIEIRPSDSLLLL